MIRWIMDWWHAHLRAYDVVELWPICKEKARDLEHAKAAFAVHAFRDPAWLCLPHDTIVAIIDDLK